MLFSMLMLQAHACDVCGGGVSNYNPALFPYLSYNYVRMNYMHRTYHRYADKIKTGKEIYNSLLVSGQYSVTKRVQIAATVPLQSNKLNDPYQTTTERGIGDISLLANYKLWDKESAGNRQAVMVGGGIKIPTGKSPSAEEDTKALNFQQGSGSMDYLLNTSYRISFDKLIFSAAASYKYNTQNNNGYRFGDMITTGITSIYRKELRDISIAPYLQLISEKQMKDADHHVLQDHSGGFVLYTGGGVDVNTKRSAFGINYQFAADQNLAHGEIIARPRISAHISFIL